VWCTCCLYQTANAFTHSNKIYHALIVELFPSILCLFSVLCPDIRFTLFYPSFLPSRSFTFHWIQFLLPSCVVVFLNSFGQGIPKICLHWSNCLAVPYGVAHNFMLRLCFCDWVHAKIWIWKICLEPSYNYVCVLLLVLWQGSIVMLLSLQIGVLFLFLWRWFCIEYCLFYANMGYHLVYLLESFPTLLVFPGLFVCLFLSFFLSFYLSFLLYFFLVATQCTHSPYVPSLSQRAHSSRRTYFGRRVWITESHIILFISFNCCFIYSFYSWCKIKSCAVSSQTTKSFSSTITVTSLYSHTYSALISNCFLTGLLASVICC
jgi:hypothetical protein